MVAVFAGSASGGGVVDGGGLGSVGAGDGILIAVRQRRFVGEAIRMAM